ncbi:MAG TPA: L,D-transpeptidase [Thermoanaerobaculia bacterium]|nr:L,D-transpeptidase [Thermoanaerobaculia bacterium]
MSARAPSATSGRPAVPPSALSAFSTARRVRRRVPWKLLLLGAGTLVFLGLAAGLAGGFSYRDIDAVPLPRPAAAVRRLESRRLERQIAEQAPRGVYVVVDTMANRLYLKNGGETLREAICSTGTGGVLEDPATGRRWVFETPRGIHRVQAKVKDPVWNKPDWAFIEDGLPIPKNAAERMDTYSLGDYALYLGDGYLIHGTLYQRLLGRSVTHGCVRLGDEDLEAVYKAATLGTRVYIY